MTFRQKLQARAKKNNSTKVLGKLSPYQIILAPLMTEKTHEDQEVLNKYVFKVHNDANKNDVRSAIKYLYKVSPLKINVVRSKKKIRSQKWLVRRAFKKAIITLWKKDKIDVGL